MKKCFFIQPFDGGKYDDRYKETFKPAIEKAGFEPYRVDDDPSVRIPIIQIEENIRDSDVVFAEITEDNPNVWFELGYSLALEKPVVLVCSNERKSKYPFDIQHRNILNYGTDTLGNFNRLKDELVVRLSAITVKNERLEKLENSMLKSKEGLSDSEMYCLAIIASDQFTDEDSTPIYTIPRKMEKAGYTDLATSLAIRKLTFKDLVITEMEIDYNNNEVNCIKLTKTGEQWMIENEEQFVLKYEQKATIGDSNSWRHLRDDEIPF